MIGFVMLCLECPGGGYVAIDKNSGGYPYITNVGMQAYVWTNEDAAKRYRRTFKKQDAWEIRELLGLKLGGVK